MPIAKKSPVRETAGSSRTDQGLSRGIPYRPFGHLGGHVISEGIDSAGDLCPQIRERHDRARGDQCPGNRVLDHRQAFLVLQKIGNKLFHFGYLNSENWSGERHSLKLHRQKSPWEGGRQQSNLPSALLRPPFTAGLPT